MSKAFLDTNILAYTADGRNKSKQKRCRELLRSLEKEGIRQVISTQVLQEFYVVATKKLGIEPLAAKALVHAFGKFEVISVTPTIIESGIECSILQQTSFWDGLIIVAAEAGRCNTLFSEDLNHAQVIRGVLIQNPFELK